MKVGRKLLLLSLAAMLSITVAAQAGPALGSKNVTIFVDGHTVEVETTAETVGQVLTDLGVSRSKGDLVFPSGSSPLENQALITVEHSDFVDARQSRPDASPDLLIKKLDQRRNTAVAAAGKPQPANVKATDTAASQSAVLITRPRDLPFQRKWVADRTLFKGTQRVASKGRPGRAEDVFRVVKRSGKAVASSFVERRVLASPVTEVVHYGTKPKYTARGRGKHLVAKKMTMRASAYWSTFGSGRTANGMKARRGVVAVDPSVIPLGTRLYIHGYGYAIAADKGGAIKGDRIDLCFTTYEEAKQFGRRNVVVEILK